MNTQNAALGMIGLGVMGRNLLLNMADQGFAVAGYDRDKQKVAALRQEGIGRTVFAAESMAALVAALRRPRTVMMLVPAGEPVDAVIRELSAHLEEGDILIDGGNSHFSDTDRHQKALAGQGLNFLGVGVSGGEYGARHGPSIMPGGAPGAYERVRPLLEAAAAKVEGDPCVTWLGPGSAGHYVKMVHNGIEYGLMELIAEAYDLMKRGLGLDNPSLQVIFSRWNQGVLNSFLIEITALIFARKDERTGDYLVDRILDEAAQKGTGLWTSLEALELQVPSPGIDMAVMMRDLSTLTAERQGAADTFPGPAPAVEKASEELVEGLESALLVAFFLTYAQGMTLLQRASQQYGYNLKLDDVARIWRGGCIIRAALLDDIRTAYRRRTDLPNLILDPVIAEKLRSRQDALRKVVQVATAQGLPVPGLMAALAYFDALRSRHLPDNLIQAQRDFFGAHTYERVDTKGSFHTEWQEG